MFATLPIILIFASMLLLTMYFWFKYNYSYWQRQGIPCIRPVPFLGNLKELLRLQISFGEFFHQLYADTATCGAPVVGIFIMTKPALLIRDTELINLVLIKSFNMFLNRYEAADPYHDPMGSLSLPLAKYPVWRESRNRMATFFTSGKMKHCMYPQMLQVARELEHHIERRFEAVGDECSSVIIEAKEMCALFTTDLTARLSYGMDANCLRDAEAPLRKQWQKLLEPTMLKTLHFFLIFFLPELTSTFRAKAFTSSYSAFMRKIVNEIIEKRQQGCLTEDHLIDLLLNFKEEYVDTEHFVNSPDFIASQAAIFLLAGFETSSSLIAFTLYELARQPLLQKKLRLEVKQALETAPNEGMSYETITKLSYLDNVVAEALRLYPAASFINRECTPTPGNRGCSLRPFFNFEVPAGMPVYISILGIHRDAKYWPNPLHFDPERFAAGNCKSHCPMAYMPFGSGPHSCVGSRLGVLQVKIALVHILKHYYVETCSSTMQEIRFDSKSFMLQAAGGIYLRFARHAKTNVE